MCFVTNGGGGYRETDYLSSLKQKILEAAPPADRASMGWALGEIGPSNMVLCYTPLGESEWFKDRRLLLIGDPAEKVKDVARGYGWLRAVHVSDYITSHPTVDPFGAAKQASGYPPGQEIPKELADDNFDAVRKNPRVLDRY